jgi:hypothetical protein
MKTRTSLRIAAFMAATVALARPAQAGDITRCDKLFEQVRAAVEKEPQKILIIVEDAMVANEACACEIVKGAILGSHASPELRRQIVLAATHVAPNMGPVIAECAGALSRGGGKEVVESVKQAIDVQPDSVQPPVETGSGGSDYGLTPWDIRGVYLIQPSTGGFTTTSTTVVVKRLPPKHSVPQSPSVAQGP